LLRSPAGYNFWAVLISQTQGSAVERLKEVLAALRKIQTEPASIS
jgi:hypothetical protein